MGADLKWLPVVDETRCNGCARCVEACGPRSLELRHGLPVLIRPDTCGSEEHCIPVCDKSAIMMRWTAGIGDRHIGRWLRP